MTISGFTMVRNASKLYFPIRESIESALPLVDEYIVALGAGDHEDDTEAQIRAIGSPKIKIFHRQWSEELFRDGAIFRVETDYALAQCSGDWCLYLQADEVLHEQDIPIIRQACSLYLSNPSVEGLLMPYHHLYGDYEHEIKSHGWYAHEVRLIKNGIGAQSYRDAISFRINDRKMRVKEIPAYIYHYGWVRPPLLMTKKRNIQHDMHHGSGAAAHYTQDLYQYGPLGRIPRYAGSHPAVMREWIARFDWAAQLDYSSSGQPLNRPLYKHEQLKYRLLTWIETHLNGGQQLFNFKNWKLI